MQGVTKRCRLIAPSYMSPNAGGGRCGVSANEYICTHGAQINFEDLTPSYTFNTIYLYLASDGQISISRGRGKNDKCPLLLSL